MCLAQTRCQTCPCLIDPEAIVVDDDADPFCLNPARERIATGAYIGSLSTIARHTDSTWLVRLSRERATPASPSATEVPASKLQVRSRPSPGEELDLTARVKPTNVELGIGAGAGAHVFPSERAKGRSRTRSAVSFAHALATAGAIGGTPGSPTPVGFSEDGTMCTSTFGISPMRSWR